MAFSGTGKIWMNGKLVEWKDATIHIASHVIHYGSGVFEGRALLRHAEGLGLLPARRAHAPAAATRPRSTGWSTRSTWPAGCDAVLDTIRANELKACYIRPLVYRGYDTLGVNPLANPVDAAIMLWEWGAYLGKEALEQGVDVKVSSLDAHGAQHAAGDGQEHRELRQLRARSRWRRMPTATRRASRSTCPATSAKAAARTSSSCATARSTRRRSARRSSAASRATAIITLARDLGFTVTEPIVPREALYIADEVFFVGTAAEVTPDPVGRQDHDRHGPPRPGHRGAPARLLRRHQRRGARHARLADLRLSGRSRPPGRPHQS